MKILIVNNMAPFVWGGAEELATHLKKNLIIAGHQAEILRIPFQWESATCIPSQMMMVRALEIPNVDHVIALKFPAYYIRHPKKTLWLLHQYRQAYDLFDSNQTNIPDSPMGDNLRAVIRNADNESFQECRNIFTNSSVTQDRLKKYNGFNSEVLFPPINDPEIFVGGQMGDYIFAGGRINNMKRQYLLLEALAQANSTVKLVIAGPPDAPADADKLNAMVKSFNLQDRVVLDLRFLPRETYASYINHAAAVAYIPFDEDSLGYVTMEAATAGKALITTTDSGGILGLVKHEQTGWVAQPNAAALANVMNNVYADTAITNNYGIAAKNHWESFGINWQNTVEKLLQ